MEVFLPFFFFIQSRKTMHTYFNEDYNHVRETYIKQYTVQEVKIKIISMNFIHPLGEIYRRVNIKQKQVLKL